MTMRPPLPPEQQRFKIRPIVTSVVIHVAAVIAFLPWFVSWQSIIAMFVTFWLTSLGVTLGYHRLLAHRSFRAPVIVERLLVFRGTWA